jgi:3',5'-cyclic AMP phosphodiesterase CpdA
VLIAHISDIHVLNLQGVWPTAFLNQRVLGGANLVLNRGGEFPEQVTRSAIADIDAQGADHLVVSGDLTNLSLPSEFERAKEVLETSRLGPENITVVPGNHDCYTLSEQLKGNFARTFARFMEADLKRDAVTFPFVRFRGEVAIIALSTAVVTPPVMALGRLGGLQLERFEWLLDRPEVKSRFRLIVLHHPPRKKGVTWHKRLVDSRQFADVVARHGADLVIHGHMHRDMRDDIWQQEGSSNQNGQPVPVIGVNSGSWMSDDPARRASYNLYRIEGRQLVEIRRRRYRGEKPSEDIRENRRRSSRDSAKDSTLGSDDWCDA